MSFSRTESQGQGLKWECGLHHLTGDPSVVRLTLFSRCSPSPPSILYIQCCCSLLIWKSGVQIWLHTSHSFVIVAQLLSHIWPLRPHGVQHSKLPCPSPFPGVAQTHVHRVADIIQLSYPLGNLKKKIPVFVLHPKLIESEFLGVGSRQTLVVFHVYQIIRICSVGWEVLMWNLISQLYIAAKEAGKFGILTRHLWV